MPNGNDTSTTLKFFGWRRTDLYRLTGGQPQDGRLEGNLPLRMEERGAGRHEDGQAPFSILGPRDVRGLHPRAFRAATPPNDARRVETTRSVHIDLAAPDLPWRYSPVSNPDLSDHKLRPWIVLIVGEAEEELKKSKSGQIEILSASPPLLASYPLSDSALWAHVQEEPAGGGESMLISRLLSTRALNPNKEYLAAVVPAFDDAGADRWNASGALTDGGTILPCYQSWRFWTGDEGDFKTLARRLQVRSVGEIGIAPIFYTREGAPEADELEVPGALTGLGQTEALLEGTPSPPLQEAWTEFEQKLDLPDVDEQGRPIIGLPTYGESWHAHPRDLPWGEETNRDPRHRGIAGLGSWVGIELQDLLSRAASDQVGALDLAAHNVSGLAFGLLAAESLWDRRLPDSPAAQLQLFGPALRRIMTKDGSVHDRITGPERPFPPGLFSSAARRLLRPGTARHRLATEGAMDADRLFPSANECPPADSYGAAGLPDDVLVKAEGLNTDLAKKDLFPEALFQALLDKCPRIKTSSEEFDRDSINFRRLLRCVDFPQEDEIDRPADFVPDMSSLGGFLDGFIEEADSEPCEPLDLNALIEVLIGAIDPGAGVAQGRVLDGIIGLQGDPLAPPEVCFGLDLTSWRFLRDRAPDWLLPGVKQLEPDSIIAAETNPAFIDAFLMGLNRQVLSELRWRNIPIATGCTPIKMFWDRADLIHAAGSGGAEAPPPQRRHDIKGIVTWVGNDNSLGGGAHRPASPGDGRDLVVVFRTELFDRYPQTIVSLVRAQEGRGGDPIWDFNPARDAEQLFPSLQGKLGEEIVFFGFDLPAQETNRYWLMLEEPPPGFSFRNRDELLHPPDGEDGASFAAAAFNDPIRVLISGEALTTGSGTA